MCGIGGIVSFIAASVVMGLLSLMDPGDHRSDGEVPLPRARPFQALAVMLLGFVFSPALFVLWAWSKLPERRTTFLAAV